MSTTQKILFFFVLPVIAPLILPPQFYSVRGGSILFLAVLLSVTALFLGPFLWRGRSTALTLAIFVQGINMVIRLMMLFPNMTILGKTDPVWVVIWSVASFLSMGLSMFLLLRLDRPDVRVTMVT
jgi:lipopolysaccharide export LptBFGC system permease protein LptF